MKTIIHKNDGRFSAFNLMTDDIVEVENIESILRCAEDSEFYSSLNIRSKLLIKNLLEECENITKSSPLQPEW